MPKEKTLNKHRFLKFVGQFGLQTKIWMLKLILETIPKDIEEDEALQVRSILQPWLHKRVMWKIHKFLK